MKRKKWSELEEQTLLSKYSQLVNSGALPKLKTREKKFKPIADHVNSLHHLQDPIAFPFKWSWRDVSIKVQNMRHQYLGVKQKIRTSNNDFNWDDGEIHWENFLKYKQVFGDIELSDSVNGKPRVSEIFGYDDFGGDEDDIDDDDEEDEIDEEEEEEQVEEEEIEEGNKDKCKSAFKGKRLRAVGAKVVDLRDVIVRREEKKREREWSREVGAMENETERKEREMRIMKQFKEREEGLYSKEMELQEMQMMREKREIEKLIRLERELEQERRQRMKLEEKWEKEEMEWKERIVEMQMEHEKQMMQMHADACQNQLQILGALARLVCQFFGSNDGMTTLPPQVLQHPGALGDHDCDKPDNSNLPSQFL